MRETNCLSTSNNLIPFPAYACMGQFFCSTSYLLHISGILVSGDDMTLMRTFQAHLAVDDFYECFKIYYYSLGVAKNLHMPDDGWTRIADGLFLKG